MAADPRRGVGVNDAARPEGPVAIVAVAANGIIGRGGTLPWRIPADLRWFREQTMGHSVIMGRRTWQSLGRALPGRRNLVLSRDASFRPDGAERYSTVDDAIRASRDTEPRDASPFVIGGASVYEEALPLCVAVLWTEVPGEPEGDTSMEPLDPQHWRELRRVPAEGCTFVEYARR